MFFYWVGMVCEVLHEMNTNVVQDITPQSLTHAGIFLIVFCLLLFWVYRKVSVNLMKGSYDESNSDSSNRV